MQTSRQRSVVSAAIVIAAALLAAYSPHAQSAKSASRVLLVVNEASEASARIAQYYASKRGVPPDDIVRLNVDPKDEVSRAGFTRSIETPIVRWLAQHDAEDRILFVVLTKGVPLRIVGTGGRAGNAASVDSELALLYRRMTGARVPLDGPVPNPYFLGGSSIRDARRFAREDQDIFLITRLDGFTPDDVFRLIDRGAAPTAGGRFLFDQRAAWNEKANDWMQAASDWLTAHGFANRVTLDKTSAVLADEPDVMGYSSWASNDPAITRRHLGFTFLPGALAATFASSDGRTLTEPPADWQIGSATDARTFFAGSPQGLAGDLIRDGITGIAGQIAEPYLDGAIRPDILFPAYVSGFTLAESFYLAMPYLSWQTVVIGDPLCAPFAREGAGAPGPAATTDIDGATGLPQLFSRRSVRAAMERARTADSATLLVKAEGRLRRDDRSGATAAYEQLAALDRKSVDTQLALAALYDQDSEYDKAIERYRQVISISPTNTVALNNLAYTLAVRKNRPQDALPLAEKAIAASQGEASTVDTLGWVYHLLGDDGKAAPLLARAARLAPASAEIHLHLAVVYAAGGMADAAVKELQKALELDSGLAKREETIELQKKLPKDRK